MAPVTSLDNEEAELARFSNEPMRDHNIDESASSAKGRVACVQISVAAAAPPSWFGHKGGRICWALARRERSR